jgi:CheY-like chemotaxis protein
MARVKRIVRRVLVIGDPSLANLAVLHALSSSGLRVVVAPEHEALRYLALGDKPHAILLLECSQSDPERLIDRIRAHRGLERVPVMAYSRDGAREPSPEDVAALVGAAAAI